MIRAVECILCEGLILSFGRCLVLFVSLFLTVILSSSLYSFTFIPAGIPSHPSHFSYTEIPGHYNNNQYLHEKFAFCNSGKSRHGDWVAFAAVAMAKANISSGYFFGKEQVPAPPSL